MFYIDKLTEIYIDNYQCLNNFRIRPGSFQLWLGDNGSGKSSVFNVLRNIQKLMQGKYVDDIFKASTLTAWDLRDAQTADVSMSVGEDQYEYHLVIEFSRQKKTARIANEELKWNGATFFLFDGSDAHLYRINRRTGQPEEDAHFSADGNRSIMPSVAKREDNSPLIEFRETVLRWLLICPVAHMVSDVAESETRVLTEHAENFAEWYRFVLQEKPIIGYRAKDLLADVLPGFEHLSLREAGQSRRLSATFRIGGKDRELDFMALSDGQRQLMMLYTILEAFRAGSFSALFIDEPDNFVSLREIQPWLGILQDVCEEQGRQAIIISHHPEIINKMARGEELWFSRKEGEHVVVGSLPTVADLPPAEIVARGWEHDE